MDIFTKKISVIATGSGYSITLPKAFTKEMKIKKGERVTITYNPEQQSLTVYR